MAKRSMWMIYSTEYKTPIAVVKTQKKAQELAEECNSKNKNFWTWYAVREVPVWA